MKMKMTFQQIIKNNNKTYNNITYLDIKKNNSKITRLILIPIISLTKLTIILLLQLEYHSLKDVYKYLKSLFLNVEILIINIFSVIQIK